MLAVVLHVRCLPGLDVGGDDQQGGVEEAHDEVVEAVVLGCGEPPFEGEDEEEDLDEVECCGGGSSDCSDMGKGGIEERLGVRVGDLRAMKTFSSGARTNCMVFWAKSAMYSSIALSVMSS